MAQCPVCNSEYIPEKSDRCSVCNWDLKSYPLPRTGKFRKVFQEKERSYLEWARHAWQRLSQERSRGEESSQELLSSETEIRIEAELNDLRSQIKQAEADRNALRTELAKAKQERAFLTARIEWIFARLETVNLEQMQESVWQLQEWANAIYASDNNEPESYLSSEVGMDYTPLEQLLGARNWRQADELTWEIMLQVASREAEGWLRIEDIEAFPSTDLGTIDWLWEYYSSGRFGYRVQQRIWGRAAKDYTEFCDRVGWRVKGNWLYYEDLNCSLNSPEGHLPAIAWRKRACYGVGSLAAGETIAAVLSRF